jgi:hypothetical protein
VAPVQVALHRLLHAAHLCHAKRAGVLALRALSRGRAGGGGAAAAAAAAAALPAASGEGARLLISALQDARSGALRARLLCGELAPAALVSLPAAALAPPEEVAAAAAASRALQASHGAGGGGAAWLPHATLVCPSCLAAGGARFRSRGFSEERDIRKAEVWGTSAPTADVMADCECDGCGHAWGDTYRSVLAA